MMIALPNPRRGSLQYAKIWFRDYNGHTTNLSAPALGSYQRLFFEYLSRQGPLPDDERLLRRIARVSARDWPDIRAELDDVYTVVDGTLVDTYADSLIAKFKTVSARNTANVQRRYGVVEGAGLRDAKR